VLNRYNKRERELNFSFEFDLLRFLCAFLCGALFSLTGSFTQLVSENDLASPSTFGFDAFAVLILMGALLADSFGYTNLFLAVTCIFFIVVGFILKQGDFLKRLEAIPIKNVILIGLGFNLLIGAVFSIIQFLLIALNFQFPANIWFGGFRFVQTHSLIMLSFFILLTYIFIYKKKSTLLLMSVGKKFSQAQGAQPQKVSLILILLSLIITVYIVFEFGVFSFLALIFPHMLRQLSFFKSSFEREILYGPVVMGSFLAVLDLLTLSLTFLGAEIPVGMLSSIVGSLVFMILLIKSNIKDFAKY
jgi:iron complex transport system permease protein